jgi:LysR family glycine cleavage system transcriptional activator
LKRLHPPTHLLRAFVAAARQSSISRAADELHLTQSAVSKQVLELEGLLGTDLFLRVRGRLMLSPAGQRYLPGISQALSLLESTTLELIAHQGKGGVLNLSSLPTFGAKWLIPRLPAFQEAHPDVSLNFIPFAKGYDFALPELDCAIRWGEGTWPGAVAHYLVGHETVLIASPELPAAKRLRRRDDIRKHVLLHHVTDPTAWARWCVAYAVDHPNPLSGPKLDQMASIIRAVMARMGIGLVPRCLVQDDLDKGFVMMPFEDALVVPTGYYLCYPEAKAQVPAVVAFRDWVLAQAGQEQHP